MKFQKLKKATDHVPYPNYTHIDINSKNDKKATQRIGQNEIKCLENEVLSQVWNQPELFLKIIEQFSDSRSRRPGFDKNWKTNLSTLL